MRVDTEPRGMGVVFEVRGCRAANGKLNSQKVKNIRALHFRERPMDISAGRVAWLLFLIVEVRLERLRRRGNYIGSSYPDARKLFMRSTIARWCLPHQCGGVPTPACATRAFRTMRVRLAARRHVANASTRQAREGKMLRGASLATSFAVVPLLKALPRRCTGWESGHLALRSGTATVVGPGLVTGTEDRTLDWGESRSVACSLPSDAGVKRSKGFRLRIPDEEDSACCGVAVVGRSAEFGIDSNFVRTLSRIPGVGEEEGVDGIGPLQRAFRLGPRRMWRGELGARVRRMHGRVGDLRRSSPIGRLS